jgi:hypothetical protein
MDENPELRFIEGNFDEIPRWDNQATVLEARGPLE